MSTTPQQRTLPPRHSGYRPSTTKPVGTKNVTKKPPKAPAGEAGARATNKEPE